MDDIQTVEIVLYFPSSLVISEEEFRQTIYKRLLCTVEIRYFGTFGPNTRKRETGIVRSLRVVFVKDKKTMQWIDWSKFIEKLPVPERSKLGVVQEAITKGVIDKLGLQPESIYPKNIMPKEILLWTEDTV